MTYPVGARTLLVATTLSFAGGRPAVTVNSWSGTVPAAPTKIDSRGVTRGTWRGYVRWFFYFDARFITEFDFTERALHVCDSLRHTNRWYQHDRHHRCLWQRWRRLPVSMCIS